MGRTRRAQEPAVALQVKVELRWVRDVAVDDGTSRAVTASVRFIWSLREEPNVVALANHNHGDLCFDAQGLARRFELRQLLNRS